MNLTPGAGRRGLEGAPAREFRTSKKSRAKGDRAAFGISVAGDASGRDGAVQVHDAALALQTARAGPETELVGDEAVRSVQAGIGHPAALLHADDDAGVAVADGIAIDEGKQVAIRAHRALVRHLPAR